MKICLLQYDIIDICIYDVIYNIYLSIYNYHNHIQYTYVL
jgi:hypothetical protein